jgi:hypothetical protein
MKILHIEQAQLDQLGDLETWLHQNCVAMSSNILGDVAIHLDDEAFDTASAQFGAVATWQSLDPEQRPWLEIIDPNQDAFS